MPRKEDTRKLEEWKAVLINQEGCDSARLCYLSQPVAFADRQAVSTGRREPPAGNLTQLGWTIYLFNYR